MANPNRAALLTKAQKVLKQHYKPVATVQRPLLEQLLFAACLENASYEAAEKAYARLTESFFDWNEVRVTTVMELTEVLRNLPDPAAAAARVKRTLQSIFEATYSFDIEALKKEKIGQGIKTLENYEGISPFMVAYATQNALGGHAVPLDQGSSQVLQIVGILSESEAQPGSVGAIDRAIPKNKGVEFGSLLHQLGADFTATPNSQSVKNILLAISPDAKDRFPKRPGAKKDAPQEAQEAPQPAPSKPSAAAEKPKPPAAAKKAPPPKKPAKPEKTPPPKKKPAAKSGTASGAKTPAKKSSTKQLAKRKPR